MTPPPRHLRFLRWLMLFKALQALATQLADGVEQRAAQLTNAWRAEVRRVVVAIVLATLMFLALLGSLAFAAVAVLLAYGEAHRVLAASVIAAALAIVALLALAGIRAQTAPTAGTRAPTGSRT